MKIKIDASLFEDEKLVHKSECNGIFLDDIITYSDEDTKVKIFMENSNIKIIRSSSDYELVIDFNGNSSYRLKKENKSIPLTVTDTNLKLKKNELYAKYKINTKEEESVFVLKYEVIK